MNRQTKTKTQLIEEIEFLESRLAEAEETLRAIRDGEVDALYLDGPDGGRIFTLKGADQIYRTLIEDMRQGAVITTIDGTVLYANPAFAEMVQAPHGRMVGSAVDQYVVPEDRSRFETLRQEGLQGNAEGQVAFQKGQTSAIPAYVSLNRVSLDDQPVLCITTADLTEQKRQETLLGSEAFLRAVLDGIGEAVVVCDQNRIIIRANPAAEALVSHPVLRKTVDEAYPLHIVSHDPRANLEMLSISHILKGDGFKGKDVLLKAPGREDRYFLLSATPLRQGKEVKGCVLVLTEMTDQKRLEMALDAEREQLAVTLLSIGDGVITTDIQGRVELMNPVAEALTGWSQAEAKGRPFKNIFPMVHEKTREPVEDPVQKVLETGAIVGLANHTVLISRDGTERTLADSGAPLIDAAGNVFGVVLVFRDVTEKRRAEEAIRQSEATVRAMFNSAPLAIALLDRHGTVIDSNDHHADRLQMPRNEILGRCIWDLLPLSVLAVRKQLTEIVFRTGKPVSGEDLRGDVWNEYSIHPAMWNDRGEVEAVIVTALDITARKRGEEVLRRSQSMLARTEGIAHVGSWEWEIAGDIVTWSDELFRIHQLDPDKGAPNWAQHHALYHPDDLERLRQAAERAISDGTPYELELRAIRRDGETRICLARGFAQMGPDGKAVRLFGSLQDITDLRRAEEALRASEERLRLANRATNDVVWDWDIVNDAQTWNDAGSIVFGWTEILSHPQTAAWWVDRIHPDDRQRVDESVFSVVNNPSEDYWHDEYRFLRSDGSYADVMDRGYVLRNDEGKALRMIGAMLDITDRKRAEEEREKLHAELLQAQKMESVGRLAGGVAHDFNNILQTIVGFTDLSLMEMTPDHPLFENLETVKDAARRSTKVIRQLLAFARKQIISPVVLDLNDAVSGMLKMLRRLIGEDIQLVWMPGGDVWEIKIDPAQIDQVLANLVINARDAIDDIGKVEIETQNRVLDAAFCEEHPECLPGEYVQLAVSDTGCGMNRETLENIFEPFFTTKEEGKGTGLGLATVYGIVRQNKGCIHVKSQPGEGCRFEIYFPRQIVEKEDANEGVHAVPLSKGTETILLVEDQESTLDIARRMLTSLGYTVLPALTPAEALQTIGEHPDQIHLLMTDVIMPGMNGRDLANHIRQLRPDIRCLYMSGFTADVIARLGVLEKGTQFIQKPFSMEDLGKKVREALGK